MKEKMFKLLYVFAIWTIFIFATGIWSQNSQKQKSQNKSSKDFEYENPKSKYKHQNQSNQTRTEYTNKEIAEYENVINKIRQLSEAKNLQGLADLFEEIEKNWDKNIGLYGELMYNTCGSISSHDFDNNEQYILAKKCVETALQHRDKMLVEQEINLVVFLGGTTEYVLNLVPQERWEKDRKERIEYWGHAWQRLINETDENYNFEDNRPINHPNLTAEERAKIANYTKQRILHKLKLRFSKQLKDFLVGAYTMPPYNNAELKTFLSKYISNLELKKSILADVEQKIIEQNSQDK